jgi:hypothetical protein
VNLFSRQGLDPEVRARLELWTREILRLQESDRVLVQEVRCPDPSCPPHGTVIAVFEEAGDSRKVEFGVPASVITKAHLSRATKDWR